jgi:hypothetical protein
VDKRMNELEISQFLEEVRTLISLGRYDFVPRRANLQALVNIGFTIADAKDEILNLKTEDYYKGPKRDFDDERPGDIWEFKKIVNGAQFYVKLKIQIINSEHILKCLSFHEDIYGYKSGGV